MQTDNTTALGVVNNKVMKKNEGDGNEIPLAPMQNKPTSIPPYWAVGKSNNNDYVAKHHVPPTFLTPLTILQKLQNRIKSLLPVARVC